MTMTTFEKTIIVVDRILHAVTIGLAAYFINEVIVRC